MATRRQTKRRPAPDDPTDAAADAVISAAEDPDNPDIFAALRGLAGEGEVTFTVSRLEPVSHNGVSIRGTCCIFHHTPSLEEIIPKTGPGKFRAYAQRSGVGGMRGSKVFDIAPSDLYPEPLTFQKEAATAQPEHPPGAPVTAAPSELDVLEKRMELEEARAVRAEEREERRNQQLRVDKSEERRQTQMHDLLLAVIAKDGGGGGGIAITLEDIRKNTDADYERGRVAGAAGATAEDSTDKLIAAGSELLSGVAAGMQAKAEAAGPASAAAQDDPPAGQPNAAHAETVNPRALPAQPADLSVAPDPPPDSYTVQPNPPGDLNYTRAMPVNERDAMLLQQSMIAADEKNHGSRTLADNLWSLVSRESLGILADLAGKGNGELKSFTRQLALPDPMHSRLCDDGGTFDEAMTIIATKLLAA